MGDPREDLTLLELENQGIPRIRVTPQPTPQPEQVYNPPPGHVGEWPRGTVYREVPPEPSLPPMQGRAPLEPDLSPGPSVWQPPRTPWQDAQAIGGLVRQGFNRFLAGPPAESRQRFEGPYTAPQAVGQGAGAVIGALVDPARRAVESQQTRSDPNADPLTQEQARQAGPGAAAEVSMNLAGINAPFAAARPGLGVFGSRQGRHYKPEMEELAVAMEKNGASPEQIWKHTGTMRGKDNIWIQEIPDIEAKFIGDPKSIVDRAIAAHYPQGTDHLPKDQLKSMRARLMREAEGKLLLGKAMPLEKVLDHPKLFAAYPELRQLPVSQNALMDALGGYFARHEQTPKGHIQYRVSDEGKTGKKAYLPRGKTFETLIHEIQHAIANIEGMAKGASGSRNFLPGSIAEKMYQEKMKNAPKDPASPEYRNYERNVRAIAADESYRLSAGEGLAKIPPQRKDMSPEQLAAIYPGSQMYPRLEQQLVEYNAPFTAAAPELQAARDPNKRVRVPGSVLGVGYQGPKLPPGTRIAPENWLPVKPTVTEPQRTFAPGVYRNPRLIAEKANEQVAAEHPALKELFGVTRADLYDISQQGRRQGNKEPDLFMPAKPGTSYAAANLQTPQNEQRILDTLSEGLKHRGLREGMVPWYVMDPMFQRMVQLVGKEQAIKDYNRLNAIVPPFSASTDVLTEINRGTAANMYAKRGDYETFHRAMGIPENRRGPDFPEDLRAVKGHAYHDVQSSPVLRWLESGKHGYNKDTVKIPTYIMASGVPETGFQTRWAVPDAHIARGSGMADTRRNASPGDYMGGSEYRTFAPWYREKIAKPLNLEAVPTQALQWGTMAPMTGVDTPIGAGKLELFSQRIWERALQLRIDPKVLRDAVLQGDAHALRIIGIGGGAGAAGMGSLVDPSKYEAYQ